MEEIKRFIRFVSEPIDNVREMIDFYGEAPVKYKLRAQTDIFDNENNYIRTEFRDLPAPNNYSEEEALALQQRLNKEYQTLLEEQGNIPNDDEYWNTILCFLKKMQLIH